ncbi:FliH/SctL family protein [Candidatus Margulisiibacteriota bacterium]
MGLIKKGTLTPEGVVYLQEREAAPGRAPSAGIITAPHEINLSPGEDISSVEHKTLELVEHAKTDAQNILDQAMSEAERIKEDSRVAGLEEAKREAEESASDKVREAIETLNEAVQGRKVIIKDAEAEILRLAIKISEQIIRSEVSLHRDVCLNIVSEAISKVNDREQVIVKVSHDDLDHIKKYKDKIAGLVDGVKSLSIVEDSGIEPGGCVIETNLGYVDARISTKLQAIEEAFKKVN